MSSYLVLFFIMIIIIIITYVCARLCYFLTTVTATTFNPIPLAVIAIAIVRVRTSSNSNNNSKCFMLRYIWHGLPASKPIRTFPTFCQQWNIFFCFALSCMFVYAFMFEFFPLTHLIMMPHTVSSRSLTWFLSSTHTAYTHTHDGCENSYFWLSVKRMNTHTLMLTLNSVIPSFITTTKRNKQWGLWLCVDLMMLPSISIFIIKINCLSSIIFTVTSSATMICVYQFSKGQKKIVKKIH